MSEKRRIVLIDDDFTTNTLNKLIIERSELVDEVVVFDKAENALKFFGSESEGKKFLILLDLNMPVMDGWDFLKEYVKLNGKTKENKVVVLTSSIDPVDRMKAEEIRLVEEYKSKPLSVEMLQILLEKYFN